MRKKLHEIRDPVHNFVRLFSQERELINLDIFQRLRHIHQLGMSHFLYPGANHTRFEHALGVMELADRVFQRLTQQVDDRIREALPGIDDIDKRQYWRRTLRMAALCHDLGHLPFSHAGEAELLPEGLDHEQMTVRMIRSPELRAIWQSEEPELDADRIARLAVGKKGLPDEDFSSLEVILAEVIVGDSFGVDRMDYLLRDSHHMGVAYGRFDHYRLVDTLKILPPPPADMAESSEEPTLGIEEGGLHSAESLLLARYFMFSQVYHHHVRLIYDRHLIEFMQRWLEGGTFPADLDDYVAINDDVVMSALHSSLRGGDAQAAQLSERILRRQHFRLVYSASPQDLLQQLEPAVLVTKALADEFGSPWVRSAIVPPKRTSVDFSVERDDGIASAISLSEVIAHLPSTAVNYVYVEPALCNKAQGWLQKCKSSILQGETPA